MERRWKWLAISGWLVASLLLFASCDDAGGGITERVGSLTAREVKVEDEASTITIRSGKIHIQSADGHEATIDADGVHTIGGNGAP